MQYQPAGLKCGTEDNAVDDEVGHRPDWQPNPNEKRRYGNHPNQDLVDMPERVEDPTSIDWMD